MHLLHRRVRAQQEAAAVGGVQLDWRLRDAQCARQQQGERRAFKP
jgi:hypothetical protein